jgi:hypothetical protein
MVVLLLQIEITISFHMNQSSLELMTYTVLLRFPFGQIFLFQTCFSACYSGEVFLAFCSDSKLNLAFLL